MDPRRFHGCCLTGPVEETCSQHLGVAWQSAASGTEATETGATAEPRLEEQQKQDDSGLDPGKLGGEDPRLEGKRGGGVAARIASTVHIDLARGFLKMDFARASPGNRQNARHMGYGVAWGRGGRVWCEMQSQIHKSRSGRDAIAQDDPWMG
ncbi:hypothetical protein ACJZ2D_005201 [Fusarium nematophilum]